MAIVGLVIVEVIFVFIVKVVVQLFFMVFDPLKLNGFFLLPVALSVAAPTNLQGSA